MKNRYLSMVILLLATMSTKVANATEVTADQARVLAEQFMASHTPLRAPSGTKTTLTLAHQAKSPIGTTDYYVYNRGSQQGYVIVTGDDNTLPVWGYVENGDFEADKLPENVRWWLGEYQRQLQWLRQHPQASPRKATTLTTSVSPLLRTQWGQGMPFNNFCPEAESGYSDYDNYYGYRAVTGCVATATAQIMKYYNWPATGNGSHSYTCDVVGGNTVTLSADFSQSTYAWSNMKNKFYIDVNYNVLVETAVGYQQATQAQMDAVARLMSDVGIAVEMSYGAGGLGGSGAYSVNVVNALTTYFNYDNEMWLQYRDYYSDDWDALLRSELDAARPIYYSGQTNKGYDDGGHAFVLDGYNTSGYFHVNWGWNGNSDGYFVSSLLNPDDQGEGSYEGGYNTWQAAIIGLRPADPAPAVLATSITLDQSTATMATGQTLTLAATVLPTNATNRTVAWTSDNTNVATVSSNGLVTAKAAGTTTITATTTDGTNLSASCQVSVTQPVTNIQLDKSTLTLTTGQSESITATVRPTNATNKVLSWESSNTTVATVNGNGLVTAKKPGSATITVTATDGSGVEATCEVTVKSPSTGLPKVSAPDLTITRGQIGKPIPTPLTLTMPEGGNFTNIQLNFTLPQGLDVCKVDMDDNDNYFVVADRSGNEGWYTEAGDDIVMKGKPKMPVVSYTDNFDEPENWPTYTIVGANITKTPNTVNPNHFVTFFVSPMEGFEIGSRPIRAFMKYTQEDDQSLAFGTKEEFEVICNVTFNESTCDVNGDGKVDMLDVNAVINIILERTTRYADLADVNADGIVNIFDVNTIIDEILAQ